MATQLPNYRFCEFGDTYIKTKYVCIFNRMLGKW